MTDLYPPVIHWPTFADSKFWCACDNRTFDSEEAWQDHVVDAGNAARALAAAGFQPPESSSGHAALDS